MQLRNRNLDGASNLDGTEDMEEDEVPLIENEDPDVEIVDKKSVKSSQNGRFGGDGQNIAVLLFLYVLQGIPLGLAAAVPLILTNRQVSYKQQAEFSFAFWPFSVKLLWAPIVDAMFIKRFGRRKTWLVPVQYSIGITMLLLAQNVDYYLDQKPNPDVFSLTCMFFFLNFLAATQDIAVDGWALTMLKRENVGYASTCNSVGQTAGYFMGYVFYMALESYGVLTLKDFLNFWAVIFMIATTLVAILKREKDVDQCGEQDEPDLGITGTYKMLLKIVFLPLMPMTIAYLLTAKIGFSACDSVTGLKLIEAGVPKDKLAMLAIPMIPLQILLPWIISKYTSGPKPMNVYLYAFPCRLLIGLVLAGLVYITPNFKLEDGSFPVYYYGLVLFIYALHQVTANCMFVAIMAFFARISDPAVGGTYMTLLNTLTNLGGNWPATLALWAVDHLTWKRCQFDLKDVKSSNISIANVCDGSEETQECESGGGTCLVDLDGYFVESFIAVIFGMLWLALWGWKVIQKLQSADEKDWRVVQSSIKTR